MRRIASSPAGYLIAALCILAQPCVLRAQICLGLPGRELGRFQVGGESISHVGAIEGRLSASLLGSRFMGQLANESVNVEGVSADSREERLSVGLGYRVPIRQERYDGSVSRHRRIARLDIRRGARLNRNKARRFTTRRIHARGERWPLNWTPTPAQQLLRRDSGGECQLPAFRSPPKGSRAQKLDRARRSAALGRTCALAVYCVSYAVRAGRRRGCHPFAGAFVHGVVLSDEVVTGCTKRCTRRMTGVCTASCLQSNLLKPATAVSDSALDACAVQRIRRQS